GTAAKRNVDDQPVGRARRLRWAPLPLQIKACAETGSNASPEEFSRDSEDNGYRGDPPQESGRCGTAVGAKGRGKAERPLPGARKGPRRFPSGVRRGIAALDSFWICSPALIQKGIQSGDTSPHSKAPSAGAGGVLNEPEASATGGPSLTLPARSGGPLS